MKKENFTIPTKDGYQGIVGYAYLHPEVGTRFIIHQVRGGKWEIHEQATGARVGEPQKTRKEAFVEMKTIIEITGPDKIDEFYS
jgi:hypothetical protein